MIRAVCGLMGLGMCLLSAPALANLSLVNYNGFEVRQSGNTWQFGHASSESTRLRGGTVLPNAALSSSQRALVVSKTLPVGKGLPVDVVAKIPAKNLAKALVSFGKIATPIGAVITAVELVDYFNDIGLIDIKHTAQGLVGSGSDQNAGQSDGYQYRFPEISDWFDTVFDACDAGAAHLGSKNPGSTYQVVNASTSPLQCTFSASFTATGQVYNPNLQYPLSRKVSSCPAGNYNTPGGCSVHAPSTQLSEQDILDRITSSDEWSPETMEALKKALDLGVPLETDAPSVSGPSSVPGEKTTSKESVRLNPGSNTQAPPGTPNTDPGTKTTTKTETKKAEYSGPNVTTSTTTNTVTNITNNVTNITTTTENKTEEKEDDKEQEDPPTDTPFKDIPELYKQKYPDGIGGVFNKKMDEMKATPLFNLPSMLSPSLPSTGSCPSWQFDLSLASWAGYGVHTIQAPCWVWDFGKVVIIISALLLARRLIFGG